jgi:UDP-GlcNAc:undecaprenyl-phosphate/decaprenyl-phosphate GlcNAc-1-phosphate transferase
MRILRTEGPRDDVPDFSQRRPSPLASFENTPSDAEYVWDMFELRLMLYAVAAIAALVAGLLLTPIIRRFARARGFVDCPGGRKIQAAPIALGGGAAVFGALLIGCLAATLIGLLSDYRVWTADDFPKLGILFIACVSVVLLGLVDDAIHIRGRYKLLGQLLIAGVIVASGEQIEKFTVFGQTIVLENFAIPLTLFWLLGTMNAINLIDGIDGLAGSVGMVLSLTIAAITAWQGHVGETVIMLALAGAQLGFLRYNFAPASIYLGDAGSMLIGLVIGAVAVHTSVKTPAALALAVPVAVWSIPILDSAAAILRRKLTGRSLFTPDRGHLHHSLLIRGWSVRQAALFIVLICATTCLSAVLSVIWRNEFIALITVLAVLVFLIFTRTFGHIEFALLRDRVRFPVYSHGTLENGESSLSRTTCIRLQGSREWDKLWTAIVESADTYRLTRLKLSLSIPALHEAFFATWETSVRELKQQPEERTWRLVHPLILDNEAVGTLELHGVSLDGSTLSQVIPVLEFLEPIEEDIRQIREHIRLDRDAVKTGQTQLSLKAVRAEKSETTASAPSLATEAALRG